MADKCKIDFPEKEVECTPPSDSCKKVPQVTPDWRNTTAPFKNEKAGVYSITIPLQFEAKNLSEIPDQDAIKTLAMDGLLDFYGKAREGISPIASFEDLELKDLYVDPRFKILPKVLVNIPSGVFEKIPTLSEEGELEVGQVTLPTGSAEAGVAATLNTSSFEARVLGAPEEGGTEETETQDARKTLYVVFRASKISEMFEDVAKKMAELSKQQIAAAYQDPTNAVDVNLSREASRLLGFKGALIDFIEKNGHDLAEIQKIKLGIGGQVQFVKVGPKIGCSEFLVQGIEVFRAHPDISRAITLGLVQRLPEIYKDVNARNPIDWLTFVNTYIPSSNPGSDFLDMKSASEVYPLRKFIADQYNSKPFKTLQDTLTIAKAINDPQSMRQRYQMLIDERIPISDEVINNFPELVENYGNNSDIYTLWGNVINTVGARGLSAMARVGLSKAMQELSINEVNELLSANFVLNLDNAALVNLINMIPTTETDDGRTKVDYKAAEILLLKGIQDHQKPWDEGLREGSFSSNELSPQNPSYDDEILSSYEEKLRFGTIAKESNSREMEEVYNAYRDAIVQEIPPEQILQLANLNFSGSDFYSTFCLKQPPSFTVGGQIPSLPALPKFNKQIKLPKFAKFNVGDFLRPLIEEAKKIILKIILNTILNIIGKILASMGDGIPDKPTNFGIESLPSSNLRTIIKNSIQLGPQAPEAVDSYLTAFLQKVGFTIDISMETRQQVSNFVDDISVTLTESELMSLLKGEAQPEVLKLVSELAKLRKSPFSNSLTDPKTVGDMFIALSNFIPSNLLQDADLADLINPSSIGVCKEQGAIDKFSKLRCSLLQQNKGLTEEECAAHLDTLRELAKNDIEDLNNILQNLDEMLGCAMPTIMADPTCPDEDASSALLPQLPPELMAVTDSATEAYFSGLNISLIDDLVEDQGFLDMVLSDKMGAGYRQHNEMINSFFGADTSANLSMFGLIASHENGPPVSGSGLFSLYGLIQSSIANFPTTVAKNLKIQLQDMQGSQPNFNLSEGGDSSAFTYTFPETNDGYSFALTNQNLNGDGYTLILEEKLDNKAGDEIMITGREDQDSDLQNYLTSNLQVDLLTEGRLTALQNTLLETWNSAEGYDPVNDASLKDYGSQLFYYFYKKYLNEASLKITGPATSALPESSNSFMFGYDPDDKPTVVYLDHNQFGGTEENPPFYLEPPIRQGWLGVLDRAVPEIDGEDPRRGGIVNFSEITSKVREQTQLFPDDDRLYVNHKKIFIPPFYQIFDKSTKALIEGVIQATVRIYIIDAMFKGLPAFNIFSVKFPENYDDALAAYIVEKMKTGLIEEGRTLFGKNEDSYYLEFLEQMVQSFGNKVDVGLAEPTQPEQEAIDFLNKEQVKLNKDCKQDKKFKKKQKLEFLRREDIQEACQIIAKRYIKEGLEEESQIFRESITPTAIDVDAMFIANDKWINGDLGSAEDPIMDVVPKNSGGPYDVAEFYNVEGSSQGFPDPTAKFEYIPFVLERYIMIEDYSEEEAKEMGLPLEITSRPSNLYGVVNVDAWSDYLDSPAVDGISSDKEIEDFWKSWKFGVRISMLPPSSDKVTTGENWGEIFKKMASTITPEACQRQKAFRVGGDLIPLFPLIMHEAQIENSSIISHNDGSIIDTFNENQECLLVDFFETPQYRSIFKYSLSFSRILSMLAIYTINGFLPSLGEDDNWQEKAPFYFGPNKGFKSWDRETFKKTKDQARMMFESLYNSQNPNYKDRKQLGFADHYQMVKTIKAPIIDEALRWWERKLQRLRPFDKDGNPKDYRRGEKELSDESEIGDTTSLTGASATAGASGSGKPTITIPPSLPSLSIDEDMRKYEVVVQELGEVIEHFTSLGSINLESPSDASGPPSSFAKYLYQFFGFSMAKIEFAIKLGAPSEVSIPGFVDTSTEGDLSLGSYAAGLLTEISSNVDEYIVKLKEEDDKSDKFDYTPVIDNLISASENMSELIIGYNKMVPIFEELTEATEKTFLIAGGYSVTEYRIIVQDLEKETMDFLTGIFNDNFEPLSVFFEDLDKTIDLN